MMEIKRVHSVDEYDFSEIDHLLQQLPHANLKGERTLAYIEKVVDKGFLFVVADEKNTVWGIFGFYANNFVTRIAYFSSIVVHETLRDTGWGTKLMYHCLAVAKEQGMKEFEFRVLRGNTRAIKLYKRFGVEIVPEGCTEEKYLMRGPLK